MVHKGSSFAAQLAGWSSGWSSSQTKGLFHKDEGVRERG
jgi:hypothetical protein